MLYFLTNLRSIYSGQDEVFGEDERIKEINESSAVWAAFICLINLFLQDPVAVIKDGL